MKRLISTVLMAGLLVSSTTAEEVESEYPREINVVHGFTRGIVNAFTFWLEAPRCLILHINKYPFFGFVSGPMEGLYFSGSRFCLSFADLAMLGATGPSAYDPDVFPEYVWQSQWNPYLTNVSPKMIRMEADFETRDAVIEDMEHAF